MTEDIYAVCYISDELVYLNEIRKTLNVGVKVSLTICRGFFDNGTVPPCSRGRTNIKQMKQEKKVARKRKMNKAVTGGRR